MINQRHRSYMDFHCLRHNVPLDVQWMDEVRAYERNVLSQRTS